MRWPREDDNSAGTYSEQITINLPVTLKGVTVPNPINGAGGRSCHNHRTRGQTRIRRSCARGVDAVLDVCEVGRYKFNGGCCIGIHHNWVSVSACRNRGNWDSG
jgi:hypothetical protein